MTKHIPVLLEEVRVGLHLQKGMTVVDATLGGGGHARMMLAEVFPGRVIALDTDREALDRFEASVASDVLLKQASEEERLVLVQSNYSDVAGVLDRMGAEKVDAILADLGFSSDQIEEASRGFSFQEEGPLDMRLNQTTPLTADQIVNEYSEAKLEELLREYGDERESRRIAKAIVEKRGEQSLHTTGELRELIEAVYPKKLRYALKIHPATKTFQALRIAVNREFEHLESFLTQAVECLRVGGRLAIITFHSGEDKRVKQFMKAQAQGCVCPPNFPVCRCGQVPKIKIVTKKAIVSGDEELARNPRARSAKLRVIEKV
ncbi:MAG: 16S rRNA (cytosine(1402)-N(4))-methyltransferase RsmH [Candidatus Moraniibacteriota bacterium]